MLLVGLTYQCYEMIANCDNWLWPQHAQQHPALGGGGGARGPDGAADVLALTSRPEPEIIFIGMSTLRLPTAEDALKSDSLSGRARLMMA